MFWVKDSFEIAMCPGPDQRLTQEPDYPPRVSGHGLMSKLFPELATLAVLLGLWLGASPAWLAVPVEDMTSWLVALEAATLLLVVALVDIASRLRQPPPWWAGLILIVGLLVVFPELIGLAIAGWQQGLWVFLPLLWSILERFRELWTLPGASSIEKLRRRALSWGRLCTAGVIFGLFVAILLGHALLLGDVFDPDEVVARFGLPLLGLFYLIAAFDAWRVHRPAFGQRPASLWPFLDDRSTSEI